MIVLKLDKKCIVVLIVFFQVISNLFSQDTIMDCSQNKVSDDRFLESNIVFEGKLIKIHKSFGDDFGSEKYYLEFSVDSVLKGNVNDSIIVLFTNCYSRLDTINNIAVLSDLGIGNSFLIFVDRATGKYYDKNIYLLTDKYSLLITESKNKKEDQGKCDDKNYKRVKRKRMKKGGRAR